VKIVVLSGGRSSEHDVSLASGASVAAGLERSGHDVLDVRIGRDGRWRRAGEEDELAVVPGAGLLEAEVVFPVLHGPFGEDGTVQGLLESLDVPYVGAGVLASAVCMDKLVFKELMAAAGLPQVRYAAVTDERWRDDRRGVETEVAGLGLPVFVKPASLGSSVGIVRAASEPELAPALESAFEHEGRVIVEAAAVGLEVECSVIGHTTAPEASEPGEIVLRRGPGWYDFEAKYEEGGMELVVPARISGRARETVRGLARDVFTRAGVAGLARVDFFVEGDDVLVNELNTIPGFTETSVFGKLWEATGLAYAELLERLTTIALERHGAQRAYRF
jgi:D-alanine-D-alanine ligase